ncbi:MAG: hypothetical protein JWM12_1690 [Ilumatobacteraceae bacterium]|nr:hypothetical protein [Ilumatobacteraceae bacterium]
MPLRLFLAAGWLRATLEKLIDEEWWRGLGVRSFLATDRPLALPFIRPLMDGVLQSRAPLVAVVVVLAELACGLAIASGRCLRLGLRVGVGLNVAFVLCGRVNPSAFYLVMEIVLLFAIAEGTIGTTPRRASRSAFNALAAAGAGAAMLPFIRTLQPAQVIADPAAMLAFLAMITSLGNAARWASRLPDVSFAHSLASRLVQWSHARPAPVPPAIARAALPSLHGGPDDPRAAHDDVAARVPASASATIR